MATYRDSDEPQRELDKQTESQGQVYEGEEEYPEGGTRGSPTGGVQETTSAEQIREVALGSDGSLTFPDVDQELEE